MAGIKPNGSSGSAAFTCYTQEKLEGRNCINFDCRFYDDTGTYEQKCMAGDYDGNPFLLTCDKYIPEYDGA